LFHTFIADWSIRPDGRLLHLRALVFGEEGRGNNQPADLVSFREAESELLGVVADILDAVQLQANEALITPGKRLCSGCTSLSNSPFDFRFSGFSSVLDLALVIVVVSAAG
jgi:hypothetical protein